MNKGVRRLESFWVGDSQQWALISGADRHLPILLVLQAGPGFPIIHDAPALERMLHWEREFVVVYWDQRGCGKSFRAQQGQGDSSLAQCVADTVEMIKTIQARMNAAKVFLLGFSLGATIGALAAQEAPGAVHAFIGVGMDIDWLRGEKSAYEFALNGARERGNQRAWHELTEIVGSGPITDAKRFLLRAKWLAEFGGIHRGWTYRKLLLGQIRSIVCSPYYTVRDAIGALQGMRLMPDLLLGELGLINLFRTAGRLDVPVSILQGRHDPLAPAVVAEDYFQRLEAPRGKELVWFESSAHMPHYEEPTVFMAALARVKDRAKNLPR